MNNRSLLLIILNAEKAKITIPAFESLLRALLLHVVERKGQKGAKAVCSLFCPSLTPHTRTAII